MQESLLPKLQGETLSAVVFVSSYVQLDFDGSRFTAYVWPTVEIGPSTWQFGDRGYRDALCAFIGHDVAVAEESHEVGLAIRFGLGSITTNPEPHELSGPEIANLTIYDPAYDRNEWMVWRPGEDVFAGRDWS